MLVSFDNMDICSMRATLSVVVITYNEAANIERCLASVGGLATSFIVVDSGSTDSTVVVAQRMGAIVYHRPFTNFADQKNFALSLATDEWILSLDADEALSDVLYRQIANALEGKAYAAYKFNRCTQYCGHWVKYGGWYPDQKLRLWLKGAVVWQGNLVHERATPVKALNVGHLQGDLLHYCYKSVAEHKAKTVKYAQLSAQELILNPKSFVFFRKWFGAAFKWWKDYFIKRGCLDGKAGWHIARISAWGVYAKYAMYQHLKKTIQ